VHGWSARTDHRFVYVPLELSHNAFQNLIESCHDAGTAGHQKLGRARNDRLNGRLPEAAGASTPSSRGWRQPEFQVDLSRRSAVASPAVRKTDHLIHQLHPLLHSLSYQPSCVSPLQHHSLAVRSCRVPIKVSSQRLLFLARTARPSIEKSATPGPQCDTRALDLRRAGRKSTRSISRAGIGIHSAHGRRRNSATASRRSHWGTQP